MLLNILMFIIYSCIGLLLAISVYKFSLEKYPDQSFGVAFSTAFVCIGYFLCWPILVIWLLYCIITGKRSNENEKENEDS